MLADVERCYIGRGARLLGAKLVARKAEKSQAAVEILRAQRNEARGAQNQSAET